MTATFDEQWTSNHLPYSSPYLFTIPFRPWTYQTYQFYSTMRLSQENRSYIPSSASVDQNEIQPHSQEAGPETEKIKID